MLVSFSFSFRKEKTTLHTLNCSSSSSLPTWVTRIIRLLFTRICAGERSKRGHGRSCRGGSAPPAPGGGGTPTSPLTCILVQMSSHRGTRVLV